MTNVPLVLYHRDLDGLAAAWACQQALGEIEAVSVNYGDPPPDVTGRNVYIVLAIPVTTGL